jgi:acyl-CoA thioesterase-1
MFSSVRIVALGDSLTVGFQSFGLCGASDLPTPYTDFLLDNIRKDFPVDSLSVEVVNKGIVGELSEQMLARFKSDVVRLSPRIVIILGGSNDLGWGLAPKDIFRNLREMYELSVENEITPIACTVPSILGFDAGIPPRRVLNKLIQEHSQKMEIRCVDLFRATLDEATSRLASRYSSDGLHLNSDGYRVMGSAIYEEGLLPMLRAMTGRRISGGAS